MRNPETKEQWQEAVNLADMWLHLEAARAYGIIAGGPEINERRCEEIVSMGRQRGVYPNWTTEQMVEAIAQLNQAVTEGLEEMGKIQDEVKQIAQEVTRAGRG